MRRVEKDISAEYPSAEITTRTVSVVSAIGRDLRGLSVLTRGLQAIAGAGHEAIGATQGPRNVDVQYIVDRDSRDAVIKALHAELIEGASAPLVKAA
jgi:aspartate kinase